ncbi:hypothetical protein [Burkholderia ambifaria]|nr:hypothetical protein [Burkholderia ambifaria]
MTVVRSIEFQRAAKYKRDMSRLMACALAMAAGVAIRDLLVRSQRRRINARNKRPGFRERR